MPIVLNSGSLNLLEPSGPVQACNGIALPFLTVLDNTGMSCETNHRFWVLGHTFLPNDGDIGVTETKSDLAKHARIKKPFTVVEMKTPGYKNMQNLCKILLREKKRNDGTKILLRKISREKATKSKLGCIIFQYLRT